MKANNSLKLNVNMGFQRLSLIARVILIGLLLQLSGCHTLSFSKPENADFAHYYLWIKSLTKEELSAEIGKQKQQKKLGYAHSELQLIMLYSLPKSPVHNPYNAKAELNAYQLEPYNTAIFNPTDLAFVVMLKDQLNQQLLILKELNNYQGAYKQAKALITTQEKKQAQQQQHITQLEKQIIQLKKIEQTINKRGH